MRRREERRLAIVALYQADVLAEPAVHRLGRLLADKGIDATEIAEVLIRTYEIHAAAIDRAIRESGSNWRLEHMAATDRAVLRAAATELLFMPGIPPAVTIDEAIELAKDYGGDEAGRFVHGVLDAIRRRRDAGGDDDGPDHAERADDAGLSVEDSRDLG